MTPWGVCRASWACTRGSTPHSPNQLMNVVCKACLSTVRPSSSAKGIPDLARSALNVRRVGTVLNTGSSGRAKGGFASLQGVADIGMSGHIIRLRYAACGTFPSENKRLKRRQNRQSLCMVGVYRRSHLRSSRGGTTPKEHARGTVHTEWL